MGLNSQLKSPGGRREHGLTATQNRSGSFGKGPPHLQPGEKKATLSLQRLH